MARKSTLPPDIARLRARMDRLNARIAAALQARARLAVRIARAKREHGLDTVDPARERAMLREVLQAAPPGFDPRTLARIFRAIFASSRAHAVAARRTTRSRRASS